MPHPSNQNRTKWGLYHYAADFWSDAMDGETAAPDPVDPSDTCAVFDSEEEAMRGLERRHHAEYDYDYQVKALPIAEAAVPQPSDQDRKAGVCVDCGVWTCSHTDARLDAAEAEVEKLRAELEELRNVDLVEAVALRGEAETENDRLRAELAENITCQGCKAATEQERRWIARYIRSAFDHEDSDFLDEVAGCIERGEYHQKTLPSHAGRKAGER